MNAFKNTVQLIGHLGSNPEIKTIENGRKMAKMRIATSDSYKKDNGERITETQWHNLVAWGKTAELVEKYLGKGSEVAVEGKLTHREYVDTSGAKRYFTEVQVHEILMLDKKSK